MFYLTSVTFFLFRLAVKYIKHMQYLMAIPPNQNIPQHIVEFDPGVPSWRKNPQVLDKTPSNPDIHSRVQTI